MKVFDGGIDRRQRVNLSDDAFGIIRNDSYTLASDNNPINYSEIICRVFLSFVEQSAAKRQGFQRITELLAKKPSRAQRKTPSLRNDVMEYISQSDIITIINNKIYGGSPGKFIKTVIEEYAEMSFIEREIIYFRDAVEKVNGNLNKQLRIVTGARTFIVKPYAIMSDKQSTYNYLICYSTAPGTSSKYEIASFRLSRIKSITVLQDSEFILSDNETDKIKQTISGKGVQFLRDELCDVIVEFTDAGKNLFNTMVFQRPEVISATGNRYSFRCTATQADFYFFKFGAEAKIVDPIGLREKFAERYNRAVMVYKDED